AGLNKNQTALSDHVNDIQQAGSSPGFAPVAAELFYVETSEALADIYDSLTPETYAAHMASATFASQQFADSMMSCPTASNHVAFAENGCVWVRPGARTLELEATPAALAYGEDATGISGGLEGAIGGGPIRMG